MKGRINTLITGPTAHDISYGLVELSPDGTILKINNEGKRLLISNENESHYIFKRINNTEIKTKLHECFMGKANEFIVPIDSHPYFFLFHRTFKEQILTRIHIYIFNVASLQSSHDQSNWNNHLLSSVGEMAAGIAHEVRNPLTAVKGFLQLMDDQSFNNKYSQIAQSELDRAIHILNDLMSVSKPEFTQEAPITFNVCSEIEALLLLFQNKLYQINLIKRFENENSTIFGQKDQVKKALFNLIKNAIEAMPEGGTLVIEQYEDVHDIHLTICDSGIGIPSDKLRLLGTPFFTMKDDGKGMGLAQVFNTIHNNKAKIRVTSEEGQGTTFILSFSKNNHHIPYTGGKTMLQAIDSKVDLADFLNKNLDFYTKEWIQYLEQNKSYIATLLKENGDLEEYSKYGNPIMKLIVQNILELKTEEIMDSAREKGISRAKTEFPIHLSWEIFQSVRGITWNAIKSFYKESQITLDTDQFFSLERHVNDIIDLYIDSYTAYYVRYKEDLLKSHRDTVDELTVPIIPIADKICILPIVGNVDTYRAKKIREKTLQRIKELKADKLIIDISGVPYVDTAVVNHLFKIVKGIKLLGCSTTLTGISAEIADTMIELGVEVDNELQTRSDLQQALQDLKIF